MAAPNEQKKPMSSLLSLQPQNTGILWDQMIGGSAILMPVSQPARSQQECDTEADSFVGQNAPPRAPVGSFQPINPRHTPPAPATTAGSSGSAVPAGPMSQLQQPLRPVQQRVTPPPYQAAVAPQPMDARQTPTPPTASVAPQTKAGFVEPPLASSSNFMSGAPPRSSSEPFRMQHAGQVPPQYGGPPTGSMPGAQSGPLPTPPMGYISGPVTGPPSGPMTNPPTVTGPPSGPMSGPPAGQIAGPPTGPSQNFRRQGPLQHTFASSPGLTHPRSMAEPAQIQAPFSQPYQMPVYQPPQQPVASGPYQEQNVTSAALPETLPITPEQPTLVLGTGEDSFQPVQCHWFYRKEVEKKHIWLPFSLIDSLALEEAFKKGDANVIVTTDGGRYDVNIGERLRHAVYWEEEASPVKRSSWFFKADGQNRFVPYDEDLADRIEEHYRDAVINHRLHHRLDLPSHECIVVHNAQLVAHYQPSKHTDEWGTVVDGQMRTRVVKRGINEILKLEEGEMSQIDHLVFLVHGVGAVCDLRFRSLVECVDDFRSMSLSLMKTHFKSSIDGGRASRVEFLPVSWHAKLHGDATGIDKRMQNITLSSIPKLRHFTNDTLMDIFFYTSPVYCQTIVDTVGSEINRLYQIFLQRNPNFCGRVSLVGHSLGSLILFDILAHQIGPEPVCSPLQEPALRVPPASASIENEPEEALPDTLEAVFQHLNLEEHIGKFQEEKLDLETLKTCSDSELKDLSLPMGSRKKLLGYLKELEEKNQKAQQGKEVQTLSETSSNLGIPCSDSKMSLLNRQESVTSVNYMVGVAGTGQPSVVYPKLGFQPSALFALGSPIAMFLTVRGLQTIGEDYHLPTCPSFFNIFHPFDPVAFRIEALIDPQLQIRPVLVPHHKGRKRMHLELRDSLTRMGTDLKQRLMDSLRNTWHSLSEFARAHRPSAEQLEAEVDRVVDEEMKTHQGETEDTESNVSGTDAASQEDIHIGQLNGGRRIDYVLQEKPIEIFNEYLFALASHACYWESEDTALMILKEVYHLDGIVPHSPNAQLVPKPEMYPPAGPELYNRSLVAAEQSTMYGGTPGNTNSFHNLSAPPLKGFVRVSPLSHR